MSGIAGMWNRDGRPVEESVLGRMGEVLAHRGPDGAGFWIGGAVGLTCRLSRITPESENEEQPVGPRSGVAGVFDGRLDNREDVLKYLDADRNVTADSPDSELVLAAYLTHGVSFVNRLVGDFAAALYDGENRRLILVRDPIGVKPLYYTEVGTAIIFASEVKAILEHPQVTARPDDEHLARHLLGRSREEMWGRSFFAGIASLSPAHLAIFAPTGSRIENYWDFPAEPPFRIDSFEDGVEAFRELFTRAVRRRLRSRFPVAVSVSGGLDSSSILVTALSLNRNGSGSSPGVVGISYTPPRGTPLVDESEFLPEIEHAYGIAISRIPLTAGNSIAGHRALVRQIESPLLDELQATLAAFFAEVHRRGARVVLSGHWADQILFDQAYLVDLFRRMAFHRVAAHLREYGRWFIDSDVRSYRRRFLVDLVKYTLPPAVLSRLRGLRVMPGRRWYSRELIRHIRRGGGLENPFRTAMTTAHGRSIYEQIRSGHHSLCLEWDDKLAGGYGVEMAFPCFDRDLLVFLLNASGEMVCPEGVPKGILREAMRGALPASIRTRTWKADFTPLVNAAVRGEYAALLPMLGPEALSRRFGYLRPGVLTRELDRARERLERDDCQAAMGLSHLLGLELWLHTFLGA